MTDKRFASLDLGPLDKTEQTEIASEFRDGYECSVLEKCNVRIARDAELRDPYGLLSSARTLREVEWQRPEYAEVALNMANSAEQLAEDIVELRVRGFVK